MLQRHPPLDVVKPLRFPGGSAGHLAVHGTTNDLAMMGARPIALSAAFVLEEGFPIESLKEIVADMAEAAAGVGLAIVTATPKWSTTAPQTVCTSQPPASGSYPKGATSAPPGWPTVTW
jgi:hydrogenase maturation factor